MTPSKDDGMREALELRAALKEMYDSACTNATSTPSKAAFLKAHKILNKKPDPSAFLPICDKCGWIHDPTSTCLKLTGAEGFVEVAEQVRSEAEPEANSSPIPLHQGHE
jgi:hypothetical protein